MSAVAVAALLAVARGDLAQGAAPPWPTARHDPQRTFGSPPATELAIGRDGTVFYGTYSGQLVAMQGDGTVKWTAAIDVSPLRFGPVVGRDGTVYVTTDIHVVAVGADGQEKWRFNPVDPFGTGAGLALAADGTIYAITLDGVTALDADGSVKWQRRELGGALDLVVGADGSVFFASVTAIVGLGPGGNVRWLFPLLRITNTIFGMAIGGGGTLFAVGNDFAYALER